MNKYFEGLTGNGIFWQFVLRSIIFRTVYPPPTSISFLFLFSNNSLFSVIFIHFSPLDFVASYYDCGRFMDSTTSRILLLPLLQMFGVATGKEICRFVWTYEGDLHRGGLQGDMGCNFNTYWLHGAVVEGLGVSVLVFVGYFVSRKWRVTAKAVVCAVLVSQCVGVVYEPGDGEWVGVALSSWGYGGRIVWDNLLVYWLSPFVGMVVSKEITNRS